MINMENREIKKADSVLVNDNIYYSEEYIRLQMQLEYSRGYSDCSKNNTVIHKAEIVECSNCQQTKVLTDEIEELNHKFNMISIQVFSTRFDSDKIINIKKLLKNT